MRSARQDAEGRGVIERSAPLWRPTASEVAQAELTNSVLCAERFPEIDVSTYEALHQWSITSTTDFGDVFGITRMSSRVMRATRSSVT